DNAEQHQDECQHQREITRPHAEGRANLQAQRLPGEEAAEGDEQRPAGGVDGIDGKLVHGVPQKRLVSGYAFSARPAPPLIALPGTSPRERRGEEAWPRLRRSPSPRSSRGEGKGEGRFISRRTGRRRR